MDKFRVLVSETVVVLPLLYASNKGRPFTARGAVSRHHENRLHIITRNLEDSKA